MVQINKEEKDFLVNKGFKWGETIHRTYSRNPHYYVTESPKAMSVLRKYRNSHTIK